MATTTTAFMMIHPSADNFNKRDQFKLELYKFLKREEQPDPTRYEDGIYTSKFVDTTATWKLKDDDELKSGKVVVVSVMDTTNYTKIYVDKPDGTETTLWYWECGDHVCMPEMPEFIELRH